MAADGGEARLRGVQVDGVIVPGALLALDALEVSVQLLKQVADLVFRHGRCIGRDADDVSTRVGGVVAHGQGVVGADSHQRLPDVLRTDVAEPKLGDQLIASWVDHEGLGREDELVHLVHGTLQWVSGNGTRIFYTQVHLKSTAKNCIIYLINWCLI